MKLPREKVPYSIGEFGNTSSASIPLTLVHNLADLLREGGKNLVTVGFGVGLSWAAAAMRPSAMVVPPVQFLP